MRLILKKDFKNYAFSIFTFTILSPFPKVQTKCLIGLTETVKLYYNDLESVLENIINQCINIVCNDVHGNALSALETIKMIGQIESKRKNEREKLNRNTTLFNIYSIMSESLINLVIYIFTNRETYMDDHEVDESRTALEILTILTFTTEIQYWINTLLDFIKMASGSDNPIHQEASLIVFQGILVKPDLSQTKEIFESGFANIFSFLQNEELNVRRQALNVMNHGVFNDFRMFLKNDNLDRLMEVLIILLEKDYENMKDVCLLLNSIFFSVKEQAQKSIKIAKCLDNYFERIIELFDAYATNEAMYANLNYRQSLYELFKAYCGLIDALPKNLSNFVTTKLIQYVSNISNLLSPNIQFSEEQCEDYIRWYFELIESCVGNLSSQMDVQTFEMIHNVITSYCRKTNKVNESVLNIYSTAILSLFLIRRQSSRHYGQ